MKTRLFIFIALSAVATLSFTFASVTTKSNVKEETNTAKVKTHNAEPAGGFLSEDKL